jgi:hypothetical protein
MEKPKIKARARCKREIRFNEMVMEIPYMPD